MWAAIARLAAFASRRQERRHDRQMFGRLDSNAMIVVPRHFQVPGHVAERPEECLQPVQFLGQERIAARFANEIVQAVIELACLGHRARIGRRGGEFANLGGEGFHTRRIHSSRRAADRLTLQDPSHLAHLADRPGRDFPHHRAAIGQQVDDANAAQFDQCLANWRVADAEANRERVGHQPLARVQVTLEDIGQDSANDRRRRRPWSNGASTDGQSCISGAVCGEDERRVAGLS